MRIISIIISLLMCIVLIGCKPDSLEIEIYTSDVESASDGEVIEVPLKATFSLMGEDKENQLPVAKNIALKYMPDDSEIEISKGTFGKVMTIVTSIPLGSKVALNKFIQQNPRVAMIVIENGMVISNEPGYYRSGKYGIRIENLEVVSKHNLKKSKKLNICMLSAEGSKILKSMP